MVLNLIQIPDCLLVLRYISFYWVLAQIYSFLQGWGWGWGALMAENSAELWTHHFGRLRCRRSIGYPLELLLASEVFSSSRQWLPSEFLLLYKQTNPSWHLKGLWYRREHGYPYFWRFLRSFGDIFLLGKGVNWRQIQHGSRKLPLWSCLNDSWMLCSAFGSHLMEPFEMKVPKIKRTLTLICQFLEVLLAQ